jgi:hypothetical protein
VGLAAGAADVSLRKTNLNTNAEPVSSGSAFVYKDFVKVKVQLGFRSTTRRNALSLRPLPIKHAVPHHSCIVKLKTSK